MTNAQVGMIAGAIVIAAAIIGLGLSGARKEPAPKDRAEGAVEFVEAIAENVQTVTEAVKVEMVRAAIAILERQIEIYAEDHEGRYPDSLDVVLAGENKDIDEVTRDLWGRKYHYAVKPASGSDKPYALYSVGPDGRDSTPDDIHARKSN